MALASHPVHLRLRLLLGVFSVCDSRSVGPGFTAADGTPEQKTERQPERFDRNLLGLSVFLSPAGFMSLLVARTGLVDRSQLPTAKKAGDTQSPLHGVTAADRGVAV